MVRRWWLVGLLAALALGALGRLACLRAEFWFDEVLSWELARQAGSLAGVFTIRHDNNHHLNTAWLVLCPDGAGWLLYRLDAFLAGLAGVVVAAVVARRWGSADAVFAAFLSAGSYWLVLASAEARGYALAVLFALLAFAALRRYLDHRGRPALVAFWLACILGFLSHLSFVHAYIGFVVWSLRRFARERKGPGDELRNLVVCHGGVAAFFAPFYLLCIRGMHVEGGPPGAILPRVGRLLVVGLGGPDAMSWWPVWLLAFVCVLAAGLWLLRAEGDDVWVFFAVAVVASPALFLLRRPPFVYERYFLIPFAFFLLLAAHVLGSLWRQGPGGRLLAVGVLGVFLAGNAWHVREFARVGRGQFHEALAWVVEHDPQERMTITGNNDFRVRKYVEFHASGAGGREVVYIGADELGKEGARWLLVHRLPDDSQAAGEEDRDAAGNVYRLVREYPSRGPEAWGWFVYRRVR